MTGSRIAARAASLGVSGVIWVGIGALFLTQAPRLMETIPAFDPPSILVQPMDPPPPPPPPVIRETAPRLPEPWRPPAPTMTERSIRQLPVEIATPVTPTLPSGHTPDEPGVYRETVIETPPGGITMAAGTEVPVQLPPEIVMPPAVPPVVVNPVRVAGANPVFPDQALEAGRSGLVTLTFTVDERGRVSNIEVLDETPRGYGFARAARAAITRWTFEPQRVDGTPVVYQARYTIRFDLDDN